MALHCFNCGGELNDWAVCQPCETRKAIANAAKNNILPTQHNSSSYKDSGNYRVDPNYVPDFKSMGPSRTLRTIEWLVCIGIVWVFWYFILRHFF